MKRKYKRAIIFLNEGHTRYCKVLVFKDKTEMQKAYKKFKNKDDGHYLIEGVHCGYTKFAVDKKGKEVVHKETGTVFLHINGCGVGVICHELAHAVLWAHKHDINKEQYPIIINNMDDEEEILYNLTYAVRQFYDWFYSEVKETTNK